MAAEHKMKIILKLTATAGMFNAESQTDKIPRGRTTGFLQLASPLPALMN